MEQLKSQKILIVAPAWLGDMLMAHSLIQVLRQQYPHAEFHILAPQSTLAISTLMPEFNKHILMPEGHGKFSLFLRWRLGRDLKKENYDIAYILPNTLKSAFVPFVARIPKRVGWLGERRYFLLTHYLKNPERFPKMAERYVALGRSDFKAGDDFPYPRISIPDDLRLQTIKKFNIKQEAPILLLSPGAAFGPAKRWPLEYFKDVAAFFREQGHYVWVIGGPAEKEMGAYLEAEVSGLDNFAGKTSLLEMAVLIHLADKVLTNDSGPMHVAAALHRPMLAIFGSSSTRFTPPLSQKATILERFDLECRPCFQRECPLVHLNCLRGITAKQVIETLQEI